MRTQLYFCLATGLAVLLTITALAPAADKADGWSQLFNGKDLAGWETWLGRPFKEKEALGLNKDPKKVYSVVEEDGKPALRISGETFGALTTTDEFEDYHLRLEFKWGEKRWPPREKDVRDSGLLYHCVGPHGAGSGFWMQSLECQIEEHDCGDYWSVANATVDVEAEPVNQGPDSPIRYKRGGDKYTVPRLKGVAKKVKDDWIVKSADHEKPTGQWNVIEVLTVGGTSVHLVNGKCNMVLTNARRKVGDREEPLTRGKIQLQSEGAEVFYRNIAVKPLKAIPEEYLR